MRSEIQKSHCFLLFTSRVMIRTRIIWNIMKIFKMTAVRKRFVSPPFFCCVFWPKKYWKLSSEQNPSLDGSDMFRKQSPKSSKGSLEVVFPKSWTQDSLKNIILRTMRLKFVWSVLLILLHFCNLKFNQQFQHYSEIFPLLHTFRLDSNCCALSELFSGSFHYTYTRYRIYSIL